MCLKEAERAPAAHLIGMYERTVVEVDAIVADFVRLGVPMWAALIAILNKRLPASALLLIS
jgi:hypothetical protein